MKNQKLYRIAAGSVCLALILSALSGCSSTDPVTPDDAVIEEPGKAQQTDSIIAVLDEIRDYRPGTLGSSLKICIVAFSFIDLSQEDIGSDIETFSDVASGYVAALDEEQLQFFKENVTRIEEIAEQLFTEGLDSLLPRLNDAGNPQKRDEYDEAKYTPLMTALKEVIASCEL